LTYARRDVRGAAVAELRARHKLRNSARKAVGKVSLSTSRLEALCSGVAEQARHHEVADAVAWFEMRGAASTVVADVLPFVKWADKAAPPAELVRFLLPVTAPSSIGAKAIEASLAPTIAGVFLRSVPLQVAMACIWTSSAIITLLIWFDVCSAWWLSLFVPLPWPAVVCCTASLNKVTPKRLSTTFQTIFVGVNVMVMFGTFCFLWRKQPAKIAALTMLLPSLGVAMFVDGYPEIGRRIASLTLFVVGVVVVALLQAGIAFNRMQLHDRSFELIPGHPTTVTAIASGAILCILTFGLKNIGASLWKPGSLVVVKDNLRSLLLPPHALQLARTAHALLALHSAKHNATLKRQLEASNSERKSIVGSFQGGPTRISPLDSLPMPTPLADSEPGGAEAVRIDIVPLKRAPREDSGSDPPTDASRSDRDKASVSAVAAGLVRECEHLQRVIRDLSRSGSVATPGSLAAQILDARDKALEVIHEAIAIANSTHSSVNSAARSLCHMSSARPHEIRKEETLAPRVSAFLIQNRRLRFWFRALGNLAWVLGASVGFALYFDARSDVWMAILICATLPGVLLNALAFNCTLLTGIVTTFQTAIVFCHTTILVGALCALCYNQPAKLAAVVSMLPRFLCAAFIDAYPAEGRAGASRLFFALNSICLVLLQVGLAFGITRIDELVVELYGGWRFKASELAAGAINSLIPFALRNLVASIHRPDTLAVRQSDVVCVYLDEHALRVLRAVHGFLMEDEGSGGEAGLLASSAVQGALGVALAGM
jgi:hypothetical protein